MAQDGHVERNQARSRLLKGDAVAAQHSKHAIVVELEDGTRRDEVVDLPVRVLDFAFADQSADSRFRLELDGFQSVHAAFFYSPFTGLSTAPSIAARPSPCVGRSLQLARYACTANLPGAENGRKIANRCAARASHSNTRGHRSSTNTRCR